MAWRIEQSVIRGEIDNRNEGRITGCIWLAGFEEPLVLELEGNSWRDLAGLCLRFTNPAPVADDLTSLSLTQRGVAGDMTAARKVKVPDCSMEEVMKHVEAGTPFPWHWANALYLEWFSESNGRVVIETSSWQLEIDGEPAWTMTEAGEKEQRAQNERALSDFIEGCAGRSNFTPENASADADPARFEDEPPQSVAEDEADAEAARMDLLMDRIQARIGREGNAADDIERILEEEHERLRRERGEPEPPPLTQEEEEERLAWIEEVNAAAEEALANADADAWKDEEERHPLITRCTQLALRLRDEVEEAGWLQDALSEEHPLHEITFGVMFAGPKMAGAFASGRDEEWPPDPLMAGHVLVRLKKARGYLQDAIAGLDAADRDGLATPQWRSSTRREIAAILDEVHRHIAEARAVLDEDG